MRKRCDERREKANRKTGARPSIGCMKILSATMAAVLLCFGTPVQAVDAADDPSVVVYCPPPLQWLCGK